jgi:hypothetical protein
MPVIPATKEAETGGLGFKANLEDVLGFKTTVLKMLTEG